MTKEIRAIAKDAFEPLDEKTKQHREKIIASMQRRGKEALSSKDLRNKTKKSR